MFTVRYGDAASDEGERIYAEDIFELYHELVTNPKCRHIAKLLGDTYMANRSDVNIRFSDAIHYCGEVLEGTKILHGFGTLFLDYTEGSTIIRGFFDEGKLTDMWNLYGVTAQTNVQVIITKITLIHLLELTKETLRL
jgi:hypothetical protein